MFGFLNPRPHTPHYRRIYARLCQHQNRHYGIWSLAFHSYEAVFLYQCAVDAGVVAICDLPAVRCCRLGTRSLKHNATDIEVGRFASSVALLLASVKLEDDLRDSPGILARFARWTLRRRIAQAKHYFNRLDARFTRNLDQLLRDHERLETSRNPIAIQDYVEPTALSFGYVFGLMAKLPGMEAYRENLIGLGRELGAAIIAFDCAVDWRRDRRRGEFNPLPDETAVLDALASSADSLRRAADRARTTFGERSGAAEILDTVRRRIEIAQPLSVPAPCPTHRSTPMQVLQRTARQSFRAASLLLVPVRGGDEPMNPIADPDGPPSGPFIPGNNPNQPGATNLPTVPTNQPSSGSNCSNAACDCSGCGSIPDCSGCDGCGDCSGCDCSC